MNEEWKNEADSIVLQIKDHFQKYGKRFLTNKYYLNIYENSRSYLNFIIKLSSGNDDIDVGFTSESTNNNEVFNLQRQIEKEKEEKIVLQNELDNIKKSNKSNQSYIALQQSFDDCKKNEQKLQSDLMKCNSDFNAFKTSVETEKKKLNEEIFNLKTTQAKMINMGQNLEHQSQTQVNTIKGMVYNLSVIFKKPFVEGTPLENYLQEIALGLNQQMQNQSSLAAVIEKKNQLLTDICKIKLDKNYPISKHTPTDIDINSDDVLPKLLNLFNTQLHDLLEPCTQIKRDISSLFTSGYEVAKASINNLKNVLDSNIVEKLNIYFNAYPGQNLISMLDTSLKNVQSSSIQTFEINKMVGDLQGIAQRYEFLIKYINSKHTDTFKITGGRIFYKKQHSISDIEVVNVVDFFRYMVDELDDKDKVAISRSYELLSAYMHLINVINPAATIINVNFDDENNTIYSMLQIFKAARDNQIQNIFRDTSQFLRIISSYRLWRRMLLNFALLYSNNQTLSIQQNNFSDSTITYLYENAMREFPQLIMNRYLNYGINQNMYITNYLAQFLQQRQNEINNAVTGSTVRVTEIPTIEQSFLAIEQNPNNMRQVFVNNNMDVSSPIPLNMKDAHPVIALPDFDPSAMPIVLFQE